MISFNVRYIFNTLLLLLLFAIPCVSLGANLRKAIRTNSSSKQCAQLFSSRNLNVLSKLSPYDDRFSLDHELDSFWDIHPRFGIVMWRGKWVLITQDEATSLKLQKDLRRWTRTEGEKSNQNVQKFFLPEGWVNGYVVDITNILPTVAKEFHQRYCSANCWSVASRLTGLSQGLFEMSAAEFHHWMSSDLAVKISADEQLKPGDMLVFRDSRTSGENAEVHGAVYISDDLFLSKFESGDGRIRLQDAQEVQYLYGPSYKKTRGTIPVVSAYKISSIDEYVKAHKAKMTQPLIEALKELKELEKLAEFINSQPPEYETLSYQEEEMRSDQKFKAKDKLIQMSLTLREKTENALGSLSKNDEKKKNFNWVLWKGIRLRILSISGR